MRKSNKTGTCKGGRPKKDSYISEVELARLAGIKPSSINAARKKGVITGFKKRGVKGYLYPLSELEKLKLNALGDRAFLSREAKKDGGKKIGNGGGTDVEKYIAAKAERELIKMEGERLKLEKENGRLINKALALDVFAKTAVVIKEALFTIPARISTQVAKESDPLKIIQILEGELERVVNSFDEMRSRIENPDD